METPNTPPIPAPMQALLVHLQAINALYWATHLLKDYAQAQREEERQQLAEIRQAHEEQA